MTRLPVLLPALCILLVAAPDGGAQSVSTTAARGSIPADTLRLGALQELAVSRDARSAQYDLEREASLLRTRNLAVSRLPQFQIRGDASYQSEVIQLPLDNPAFTVPPAPKDRYEVGFDTDWTLWDGGLTGARREVETSRLYSTLAALDAEIFGTRAEVTDAFFSALLLQEQVREVEVLLNDLGVRLEEMQARIDQGLALAGDMAVLQAERLVVQQQRDALSSERQVSLGVLSRLTGQPVDTSHVLALPDLSPEMAVHPAEDVLPLQGAIRPASDALRLHPRFAVFDARRETGEQQVAAIRAGARPSVALFGQLNYGSPGFDQFNDRLHEYWRAGVRLRWTPWTWQRRQREEQEVRLQQRLIDTEEAHFSSQLLRMLERPVRAMETMRAALETDDRIVALREQAEAHARLQFEERALSASAYTGTRTDLQEARIARLRHRIEWTRAQAHYLITLGVELR